MPKAKLQVISLRLKLFLAISSRQSVRVALLSLEIIFLSGIAAILSYPLRFSVESGFHSHRHETCVYTEQSFFSSPGTLYLFPIVVQDIGVSMTSNVLDTASPLCQPTQYQVCRLEFITQNLCIVLLRHRLVCGFWLG